MSEKKKVQVIYRDINVYKRPKVIANQLEIRITAGYGVDGLRKFAETAFFKNLGKVISLETDHTSGTDKINRINVKVSYEDGSNARNIIEMLENLAKKVESSRELQRVEAYIDDCKKYLGNWSSGNFEFDRMVSMYLKRAYDFSDAEWGIGHGVVCSNLKGRNHSKVRHAMMYALSGMFPYAKKPKMGLSSVEIGKIFGYGNCNMNHATVLMGRERVEKAFRESKKKKKRVLNFDLVEMVLENAVDVLGGIE